MVNPLSKSIPFYPKADLSFYCFYASTCIIKKKMVKINLPQLPPLLWQIGTILYLSPGFKAK